MSSAARKIFAVVREGDQEIGTWSIETAPTPFLKGLVEQAVEDGDASAKDEEGCTVTAVLVGEALRRELRRSAKA